VLLLGGTGEARELADLLVRDGVDVVSSLAGRVSRPRLPAGRVRRGGFGGVDGLRAQLDGYDAVVDATHPFAATISAAAARACSQAGVPLLRLARPSWSTREGARRWRWVSSPEEAGSVAREAGGPVFLTTGRQSLTRFRPALDDRPVLARVVDPVTDVLPASWSVLLARGPYTLAAERALMRDHEIAVLVTKDSGGDQVSAKLDAADDLGIGVVVVRRPAGPEPGAGRAEVADVAGALRWLRAQPG
jgi:precorrin-6A/cobalt-precorrin-6A reductase